MIVPPAVAAALAQRWTAGFLALALGLTALRVVGLMLTPLDLHGDEAQYWLWAQELDWGYFSKPPLIAWAIAAATAAFGDAEWAVRLSAPLAHGLGAGALFLLGRRLYGAQAGFLAGAAWLVMPGVWLSASVISTDALLLPLWSLALLALFALLETRARAWAVTLGIALGLGFLAKYAMSYFLIGMALCALMSPGARTALLSWNGAIALGTAGAILAPNLVWNATNDFATIGHTAANANVEGGFAFSLAEVGQFVADQLGVFGPLSLVALGVFLYRGGLQERERLLLAFVAPPLLVILAQAFLSRAHANWAAAAYPAATVLLVGLAMRQEVSGRPTRLALVVAGAALLAGAVAAMMDQMALAILAALVLTGAVAAIAWFSGKLAPVISVATHGAVGLVFMAAALSPGFANAIGLADAFKRSRAWEETAALVAQRAQASGPYTAVLVDNRLVFNDLSYYWREGSPAPLRIWLFGAAAENHAEQVAPMTAAFDQRVLVVGATQSYEAPLAADFAWTGPIERVEVDLGGGEVRRLSFREASGFQPRPRD